MSTWRAPPALVWLQNMMKRSPTMVLVTTLATLVPACGGDDEPDSAVACPELTVMVEGASWTYGPGPTAPWTGQVTETIVGVTDNGDRLDIDSESVGDTNEGFDYHFETETRYRCDTSGLLLVHWSQRTDPTGPGTGSTFYEVTYDPPWLLVPTDLAGGSTWRSDMELTVAHTTQEPTPQSVSWEQAAVAETVDTPAGSFEAITVTTTTEDGTTVRSWSAGVGAVVSGEAQLESYTAP